MTTEAQIEALAEALGPHPQDPELRRQRARAIRAILAALPPDWCGHEARITELEMEFGDACLTMDEQRVEIARLRPIEEVLVALIDKADDALGSDPCYGDGPQRHDRLADAIRVARAALEAER